MTGKAFAEWLFVYKYNLMQACPIKRGLPVLLFIASVFVYNVSMGHRFLIRKHSAVFRKSVIKA